MDKGLQDQLKLQLKAVINQPNPYMNKESHFSQFNDLRYAQFRVDQPKLRYELTNFVDSQDLEDKQNAKEILKYCGNMDILSKVLISIQSDNNGNDIKW